MPTSSEGRGTRTTCPTCGEPVIVYNDENGPHVESLAVAEIERLEGVLCQIWGMADEHSIVRDIVESDLPELHRKWSARAALADNEKEAS